MPSFSELPGEIKRSQFLRALIRLGFEISEAGGNGSHYKATWPRTQKAVTIEYKLPKQTLKYLIKEIEEITGGIVTWQKIKEKL